MEATQESTQPSTDPRRMGRNNSGLHEQDLADIICILHPNSHSAHDAVAATARLNAQHILQRDTLEYESSDTAPLDVALRLSSDVNNLGQGFCFGRNRASCDVLLSPDDEHKRVSNMHFRIYLTRDGIAMLQDTSTNGTIVDNCRLRKIQINSSRMLINGSMIQVVSGNQSSDEVRFVVRIPSREGFAAQYTHNLLRYLERVEKHATGAVQHRARHGPTQPVLSWSVANTFGMHWSGGSMYNVTGQIGKGAFATVYKLATKQHGAIYAAKELDKRRFMKNGILDQKVDNEMKIMRDISHPNIVQYIDHHEHDRWIYIIMEYVPHGELSTYLHSHGKIPEDMVRTVARQVLRALHYLHQHRITHRDIKPDNILIASLDPLKVKLSDFGLSKVVQEESFLQTFCGTLLYCAPEVYPDYETYRRGEARKRRRAGDPPPKTSPYNQSVDIWSLGAVLYHILSGVPPYSGHAEDRGVHMLRTIMTTDVDFGVLRRAGVSEAGIDFVTQLLNREPFSRPTEKECFQHPWIAEVPDVDEYDDGLLADRPEGLAAIGEDAEEELSQLSLHDQPAHTYEAGAEESSSNEALAKKPRIEYIPADIRYPSLPDVESFQDGQVVAEQSARRLFGEVTASALASSNALGDVDPSTGDEFDAEYYASSGESMSDGRSVSSILSLPDQPFGGTAPSLMGAENLVGRLNMDSLPPFPQAGPVNDTLARKTTPGDPKDPAIAGSMPQAGSVPASSRAQTTPKALRFPRRIDLALPDTASERSSDHSAQASRQDPQAPSSADDDPELATTLDARTGQPIVEQYRSEEESSAQIMHQPWTPGSEFVKPRPVLGKLTSVPGSIFDVSFRLENRMTSWGRGLQTSIRHPNPKEERIPKYALEITFWAPGIESQIAAGQDWMKVSGVMAILSTKTSKCIWVNGTELRRGSSAAEDDRKPEGLYFGKLYTGDIITVYQKGKQFLKLRCEFYHSDSARVRPEDESGFQVRQALMIKHDGAVNRLPVRSGRPKEIE